MHDTAKFLRDLAVGLAIGGDSLADIAVLRREPDVFGLVASDPTVSRTSRLASDVTDVLAAIDSARAHARAPGQASDRPVELTPPERPRAKRRTRPAESAPTPSASTGVDQTGTRDEDPG